MLLEVPGNAETLDSVAPALPQILGCPNSPMIHSIIQQRPYPLTRRLFVIVKRDRLLDEQAGIAYANLLLSDEGQKLIEQAGFVPVR